MRIEINEFGEKVVTMTLKERGPLTQEEKIMIKNARNKPAVYDEDCPPMTTDQLLIMKPGYFSRKRNEKVMV